MTAVPPMQSYFRNTELTVDTHNAQQTFFEEDSKGDLDSNSVGHPTVDSGLELSPPITTSRRESFAMGSTLFSPKSEDWSSVDMQHVPSNNTFMDHHGGNNAAGHNPFMQIGHNQGNIFAQATDSWGMGGNSGAPGGQLQQFDGASTAFNPAASIFQRPVQNTSFNNPSGMFASYGQGEQSMPTSPQKDWVANQTANKKSGPPTSPGIRSHNELRRGDGIRKKNARFEIPAERNLSNIDHLIAQSTDEQEVKELKQQKRLLRNRQAALDSRQRKKMHTERLEDEKKHYSALMTDMEDELTAMKDRVEQLLREKQSYHDYAETLTLEKDEMIRAHTIETGELRKKVSVLTEHVQRLESQPMANPSSAVFSDNYDGMDGMGMPGAWDQPNFLGDFSADTPTPKGQFPVVPVRNADGTAANDGDKGTSQGGLLFMLFLVGAFVMSSRSTPAIPRVSEDVRVASATLLDNVLREAGISSQASDVRPIVPQPSNQAWETPSGAGASQGDVTMGAAVPSMLDELGESLTQPTEQQMHEQIFSLSAAQYDGVSSSDFLQQDPERSMSEGRKNLAGALNAMRAATKQSGAAEVYTRSLLWDQIPNEVVRNFAKMVAECNDAQTSQQCDETQ